MRWLFQAGHVDATSCVFVHDHQGQLIGFNNLLQSAQQDVQTMMFSRKLERLLDVMRVVYHSCTALL